MSSSKSEYRSSPPEQLATDSILKNEIHIKVSDAKFQNDVNSTELERILGVASVTTASPLTPIKDETARTIDERSEGYTSVNNDDNVGDDNYDYERDECGSLTSCCAGAVLDDVPVTPKRPSRLLDPAKLSNFNLSPSIFNEVMVVSAGVIALGVGIYMVYQFIKRRSAP
uniref:Uncharacterized protein n=1 Tax=Setaria digitata TaxID=48799 RepID=A0A915PSF7_9BILA